MILLIITIIIIIIIRLVEFTCVGDRCNNDIASGFIDADKGLKSVVRRASETTTQPPPTTTTTTGQCYVCSQDTADANGDCWNPDDAETQNLEVCEHGCYQRFYQANQRLGDKREMSSSVTRQCRSAAMSANVVSEYKENFHCYEESCNNAVYEVSNAPIAKLNCILLSFALFLILFNQD